MDWPPSFLQFHGILLVLNLILFAAAFFGGVLNSVAGGGSFLTLPALLYSGIAPVAANATSTLAVWPGAVSSAIAYRHDIKGSAGSLARLGIVSLAGGLVGALLLVKTSDTSFMRLLPWLMLLAAATFTFGGRLTATIGLETGGRHTIVWWGLVLQFVISVYGGYFGGGMGIMMLATFAVAGMTDIHEMNGLKSLLGAAINGIALVEFIAKHAIVWQPGLLMVVGTIAGGYVGASLARRIDRRHVRMFVIVIGWAMTVYFAVKS